MAGKGHPPKHPLLKRNSATFRLPQWLLEWMQEQGKSQSVLIEEAVREKYKLKPPKIKKEN